MGTITVTNLGKAYKVYPTQVTITSYAANLMGVPGLPNSLKTQSVDAIIAGWQTNLARFRALPARHAHTV